MSDSIRISVDAMGGDKGPHVVFHGARLALRERRNTRFIFHGRESELRPLLDEFAELKPASRIVHSDNVIAMDDKPSNALRRGRGNSSMWAALESVRGGEADVAVSGGNTGALMAMSKFSLKTMADVERPAIAAVWPTLRGESVVLDVGASIGADAQHLVDMAVMGAAMARVRRER